jgi:quercetin dioxygenase-like cupin family protein
MSSIAADDVIRLGPIEVRYRLEAGQTAGNLTMFEFTVRAQARVPVAHSHDAFDETVYGLDGILTWTLDGETRPSAAATSSSSPAATCTASRTTAPRTPGC